MASDTNTRINYFKANFGYTPNGMSGVPYKAGINYVDNATTPTARISGVDKHTPGEVANTNLVSTQFISAINPHRDTTKEGVNLFVYSPQAIQYAKDSSTNQIIDARAYVKFFFSGVQYLKLSGNELHP